MTDRDRETGRAGPLASSGLADEAAARLGSRPADDPPTTQREGNEYGPLASLLGFADRVQGDRSVAPTPAEGARQFVAFWVCGAEYALPIEVVQEVLRVDFVSRVPQAPPHIRGVTNIRGRVIPVVELSTRLGGRPLELTPESCIVATAFEGRTLGLLVERASTVISLPDSAIEPPPEDVLGASAAYISGVGKDDRRVIILIDLERVLATES